MERDRRGHRFAGGSSAACPASRRASRRHRTDRGIGGYSALWCAGVSRLDSVALAPAPTVRDVARSGHRATDLCRHVRAVNVRHWPCDEYGGRRKAGVGADGGPRRTSLLTPVQSRSAVVLRSSDNAGATAAVAAEVLPTDKISDVTSPTSSSRRARFRRGVTSLFTAFNICSAGIYFCGDL